MESEGVDPHRARHALESTPYNMLVFVGFEPFIQNNDVTFELENLTYTLSVRIELTTSRLTVERAHQPQHMMCLFF